MKRLTPLLAVCVLSITVASCGERKKPTPPPVVVQDFQAIGEGMKVFSYAFIGVAVIIAVALMNKPKKN